MNIYRKSDIPEHLHKYFKPAEIGLEKTPDEYVHELVNVFREVKRVLRDDGTVWLNIGDSYATHASSRGVGQFGIDMRNDSRKARSINKIPAHKIGLKEKDLIGIPWRVAFALQSDGWYLRQDIIWHKPNPMPESVKDRCTKAHEYIFLLSKSAKYYYDAESIKTDSKDPLDNRGERDNRKRYPTDKINGIRGPGVYPKANRRSVWTINTKPYKGAHFATFPIELVEPCILAGCPAGGTVLDPFGGSGTVGECCRLNQRNAILIELNKEYEPLIQKRIGSDTPELAEYGGIV
jgi:site-specific DNA-methyltransferase (adenine-specific)